MCKVGQGTVRCRCYAYMMTYNYPEGNISYISVLIEKKTCPWPVTLWAIADIICCHFGLQKGKIRLLSRRGSLFADSEKVQLYFQKAFLIKLNYRIWPNYRTYPYKRTVKKFRSLQITTSVLFSLLLYKGICWGYSFELHWQVGAIQMSPHNICLCKESQKKSHSHH